jgi:hypothetical protein
LTQLAIVTEETAGKCRPDSWEVNRAG